MSWVRHASHGAHTHLSRIFSPLSSSLKPHLSMRSSLSTSFQPLYLASVHIVVAQMSPPTELQCNGASAATWALPPVKLQCNAVGAANQGLPADGAPMQCTAVTRMPICRRRRSSNATPPVLQSKASPPNGATMQRDAVIRMPRCRRRRSSNAMPPVLRPGPCRQRSSNATLRCCDPGLAANGAPMQRVVQCLMFVYKMFAMSLKNVQCLFKKCSMCI